MMFSDIITRYLIMLSQHLAMASSPVNLEVQSSKPAHHTPAPPRSYGKPTVSKIHDPHQGLIDSTRRGHATPFNGEILIVAINRTMPKTLST